MKHLFTFLFLCTFFLSAQAQVIWSEDFSTNSAGDQTGDDNNLPAGADWTTDISGLTLDFGDLFEVSGFGDFEATDIDGVGIWTTEAIDISSATTACISIQVGHFSGGLEPDDFIRVSYQVDGGTFVVLSERFDDFSTTLTDEVCGIAGSSLVIRVEADNDGGFEGYFWDNIVVTNEANLPLFSTANSDWDDRTTWSTIALGGATCNCTPNDESTVTIGDGNTVDLNVDSDVENITIENTGTLQWTAANIELNITNGGTATIDSGGTMDENGQSEADLDFNATGSSLVVNDATSGLSIENIYVFSGGTLSISGNGLIDLSGEFFINSSNSAITNNFTGTFNVTDDIQFVSGFSNSSFVNNGTITITDDLFFDNDNCTFTNNGTISYDDVNVNNSTDDGNVITNSATGTMNIGDEISTANGNLTINNSGIINQTGIFTFLDAGSAFNNLDGATWNYAGASFDADTQLFADNGTNTFNYNLGGAQDIITPQDAYSNLTVSGSGAKRTQGDFAINGDFTRSGGVFNINVNNNDITLAGNWTNSASSNGGGFNEGNGTETLTLNGSSDQSITSPGGEIFRNLVINKPGGSVTLNSPLSIENNGNLTFTQGIINTTSTNVLIFITNAASNGGDADSYVDGPVQKIGTTAFTFPTGDGGKWARIGITAPSVSSTFTAEYFSAAHPDQTNLGTLNNVSVKEYWNLDRAGTGSASVTLFYEDAGFSGIDTPADLVVAKYNGANWVDRGQLALPSGSVTSSTAITSFSPFTFGSNDLVLNPLPVEFITFTGNETDEGILLEWKTASELNNDFFEVQRSIDAQNWDVIGQVTGNGTTDALSEYDHLDAKAPIGQVYYRLRQVDFDGVFEYSDIVGVLSKSSERDFTLSYYPNPVKNILNLDIFGLQGVPAKLQVIDITGKMLIEQEFRAEENNKSLTLDTQALPSGVYTLSLVSVKGTSRVKFVK